MSEFQVLSFPRGVTTVAPCTSRARAWLEFYELKAIMERARPLVAGGLPLEVVLNQMLAADLGEQGVQQ
ncbi:hypothetical protein [Rubrivivax albus]|uniref:Uncharacterized protein n=1 Tax=Rubrivivax albus TaxID=2499835 RepID=A0A437K126_9BURK|nr:hypothetical protein [Rubrivivax albus]RVT53974.1 hypothetical protein ENE75_03600 [Rubrivivax albus]